MAHVCIRRLTADDSTEVIVLGFSVVTAVVILPLCMFNFVMPTGVEVLGLVGIASAATGGQLLMTSAYRIERAPVVSTAGYTNVVLAIAWGYLFWGERPGVWALCGGILIVGGGVALGLTLGTREQDLYGGRSGIVIREME